MRNADIARPDAQAPDRERRHFPHEVYDGLLAPTTVGRVPLLGVQLRPDPCLDSLPVRV